MFSSACRARSPPRASVPSRQASRAAVCGRARAPSRSDLPGVGQRHVAGGGGGADGEQAHAVLAGQLRPGGRDHRRRRHLDVRAAPRAELQARVHQREPVDLWGHRLALEERRMTERASSCMSRWRKGSMPSITASRQRPRAHPEHRAPARLVVELLHRSPRCRGGGREAIHSGGAALGRGDAGHRSLCASATCRTRLSPSSSRSSRARR